MVIKHLWLADIRILIKKKFNFLYMFQFSTLVEETKDEGLHENMVEIERRVEILGKCNLRVLLYLKRRDYLTPTWLEKGTLNLDMIISS